MTNLNMRRILKTPTLRMMDGGDIQVPQGPGMDRAGMLARNPGVAQNQLTSPSAPMPAAAPAAPAAPISPILRDGNSFSQAPGSQGPTARPIGAPPAAPTIDQGAAMDRKMLAASAPMAPAAPTPAGVSPMPAATTQGQRQAGFAMQAFGVAPAIKRSEPDPVLGMKDGGSLRTGHGGHVPGTGQGDKIAAKYEPGEFVVSNDMLDAEPGLREQLHSLRTEVLADKGMTPGQADAKAMSGGTLRALEGGPEDTLARRFAKAQTGKGLLSAGEAAAQSASQPGVGIDAAQDAKIAMNARMAANARAAELAAETAGRGPGVRAGPAFTPTPNPLPTAAPAAPKPTGIWNSIKGGASNIAGGVKSVATGSILDANVNNPLSGAKSVAGTLGRIAGPIGAATQAAESYDTPTENYEARFGAGASPGLRGGLDAVKAFVGMGAGNKNELADTMATRGAGYVSDLIANTVDGATGAANWVGSKLGINPDIPSIGDKMRVNERAEAAKTAPAQTAQRPAANIPGQDATMPGQDPGRAAADPKLVQGADGRQYLPEAVGADDRLRSDGLIKQAFSRNEKRVTGQDSMQGDLEFNRNGMNDGINTLRSEPAAIDTVNKAWAMRGAGVKASLDSKGGLVLSDSTGPEKMRYTDREGKATNQYENTAQYDNGQKQLAAASASLRNPDGTKWSANDTATMAANLRDGVDQYRGTSRAPAAAPNTSVQMSPQRARLEALGAKGMSRTQAATLQALRSSDQQLEASNNQNASAIKREQMQNDTLRDNNAATNQTSLRGHQLDFDAKAIAARSSKVKLEYDMAKDARDFAMTKETHDQTVGTKARENAMKEFRVADSKDPTKFDDVASQQSFDAVRQIFPKIGSTNEADREAAMPDAKAMANIFNKARTQDKVGWDAMKFWEAKRPVLNGMPDVSGTGPANVEQVGPLAGVFTLNASNGHTVLTQKDGRKLNFGILDSRERALLENAQKKGWGN